MKLRFGVNRAEVLGQDIDPVTIDADLAKIPQNLRKLILDRLEGIDVCSLSLVENEEEDAYDGGTHIRKKMFRQEALGKDDRFAEVPFLIQASSPTLDALIEAVSENETEIRKQENWLANVLSAPKTRSRSYIS